MLIFPFLYNWLILSGSCSDSQTFIPAAELAIPTGTEANDSNAQIETQPVIVESKISK